MTFSLTLQINFPDLVNSQTFLSQLLSSLTFPVFPDEWSPCSKCCNCLIVLHLYTVRFNIDSVLYDATHAHVSGPFSRIAQVSRYRKYKTSLDFSEARDNEWQRHQLGHVQVCTLLQTDNHVSTPPLSYYRPSCHQTNSIKALKTSSDV